MCIEYALKFANKSKVNVRYIFSHLYSQKWPDLCPVCHLHLLLHLSPASILACRPYGPLSLTVPSDVTCTALETVVSAGRPGYLVCVSRQSQPTNNQCCGWTGGHCGFYYESKMPSARTISKLWQDTGLLQDLEMAQHGSAYLRATQWQQRSREREREKESQILGFCVDWGWEWGLGFAWCTIYWWI